MAGRGLGQLTLDLVLKMGGFTGPLDKAGRDLDKKTKAMEARSRAFAKNINSAFGGMALKLGASLGGFFAVSKGIDAFFSSIDRADKMRDLSIQLGIGVESLSALSYAASQTGVDLDTFSTSLLKLEKTAAAALDPKSTQRGLFDAILGKGQADLANTEHLLLQLGDAFKAMGDSPHKAALEMELFGKSGAKMAEFLSQGADGIKTLTDRAGELGVTISQDAADGADRFNDKLGDLQAVSAGLGTQLATALMPQVEALLDWAIKFGSDPGNVEKLVKDTTDAFNNFATAIGSVATTGSSIYTFLDGVQSRLQGIEKFLQGDAFVTWGALAPDGSAFQRMLDENQRALNGQGSMSATLNYVKPPPAAPNTPGGPLQWIDPPTPRKGAPKPETDAEQQKRIAAYLAGNTAATKANADAKRAAAEAAREQEDRERKLAEAVKDAADAQADFQTQLEDLIAQQGGPLAESQLHYRREEEKLTALHKASSTPVTAELEQAIVALHAARDADAESIRKQTDTGGEHLKQMQAELDLLHLSTQAERDRAAFLRDNPTATGADADKAAAIQAQIDETRRAINAADEMRSSFEDAFMAVGTGSESAMDALKDFADAFIRQGMRMAAQAASLALFGEQGTSGSGFLGSLLGKLFGGGGGSNFGVPAKGSGRLGGFANGTTGSPGGAAWVGERGPEIVNLPRGSQVIPNHALGGGGVSVEVNITNKGKPVDAENTGSRMEGGKLIIDMVIAEVDSRIARMGSTGKAMSQRFNLQPAGVSRG